MRRRERDSPCDDAARRLWLHPTQFAGRIPRSRRQSRPFHWSSRKHVAASSSPLRWRDHRSFACNVNRSTGPRVIAFPRVSSTALALERSFCRQALRAASLRITCAGASADACHAVPHQRQPGTRAVVPPGHSAAATRRGSCLRVRRSQSENAAAHRMRR